MTRTALLALVLLAGCATSSPQPASRAPPAPAPYATSSTDTSVDTAPAPRRTYRTRASDVALSVVGTPFVFGFRAVVCAASAVVAGPAAALFAVSDDPRDGFAYLRHGLARNCGPPYAVPLPSATDRAREGEFVRAAPEREVIGYAPEREFVRYAPGPDLGPPRPLTPYSGTVLMSR
jgi:hypothetical protein